MRKTKHPKRTVLHVSGHRGHWTIQEEGRKSVLLSSPLKSLAIQQAIRAARAKRLGQVIVHNSRGAIQTEFTYGQDPHRTPG